MTELALVNNDDVESWCEAKFNREMSDLIRLNQHTDALLLLCRRYGTNEQVSRAYALVAEHTRRGYQTVQMSLSDQKLRAEINKIMKRKKVILGEAVVMSDAEYDEWIDDGMPSDVVSAVNPTQVGTLDSLLVGLANCPEIKSLRENAGLNC